MFTGLLPQTSRSVKSALRLALFLTLVAISFSTLAQSKPSDTPQAQPASTSRPRISEASTSDTVTHKVSPRYPEAARKASIQGKVVLSVVIDKLGNVQQVNTVSGDTALAEAAAEAVRQWKYQPYLLDGVPSEIETQVTLNFRLQPPAPAQPFSLGAFRGNSYNNEYFGVTYPLPADWIRVTEITRRAFAAQGLAASVLFSVVHIPQDLTDLRADSSFVLAAVPQAPGTSRDNCKDYLEALLNELVTEKSAGQKGDITEFSVSGFDFLRMDLEYRSDVNNHASICSANNHYLLVWEIAGLTRKGVDLGASTIHSIVPWQPTAIAASEQQSAPAQIAALQNSLGQAATAGDPPAKIATPSRVRIATGLSAGLLLKKVPPVYPPLARSNRIQGSVTLQATIDKNGDIQELELLSGPIELAVSAVTAVRQWKYRPYLLNGDPVSVETQIIVNYKLQP
jgi:TonB family protein